MEYSKYKDIYALLSARHPNKRVYVISDHHFYHDNIISYNRTEFSDITSMHNAIINKHNEVVTPDDVVIFLGDFSFRNGGIQEILSQLNGFKYLIMGNHDSDVVARKYGQKGLEGVFENPIRFNNQYLSHEPLCETNITNLTFKLLVKEFKNQPNAVNLHGHLHLDEFISERHKNVSCEVLEYTPYFIGMTGNIKNTDESLPLFINSPDFDVLINHLNENSCLFLIDYIYSSLLEMNNEFKLSTFVYGSYPFFKKYGYISTISDLDIGILYNGTRSKRYYYKLLKIICDIMYARMNSIYNMNSRFLKRIAGMSIFESSFVNKNGVYAKTALDMNAITIPFHKDSDFVEFSDVTNIEKFLRKQQSELLSLYHFPEYHAQFLSTSGDFANMLLQFLFQKGNTEKKNIIRKKIMYLFRMFNGEGLMEEEFADILIRFFLRNIKFFDETNREEEINHIKEASLEKLLKLLPERIGEQLIETMLNPNSDFKNVFNEIKTTPNKAISEQCLLLIKSRF